MPSALFSVDAISTRGPTGLALILAALRYWTGMNVSHLKVPRAKLERADKANDEEKVWRT